MRFAVWFFRLVVPFGDFFFHKIHTFQRYGILLVSFGQYRGKMRYLADGTILIAGSPLCFLHLDNNEIQRMHTVRGGHMGGIRLRRAFVSSLHKLTEACREGEELGGVVAFVGKSLLGVSAHGFGFEIETPKGIWTWIESAYARSLLAWQHPEGLERLKNLPRNRIVNIWISRHALMKLHG